MLSNSEIVQCVSQIKKLAVA